MKNIVRKITWDFVLYLFVLSVCFYLVNSWKDLLQPVLKSEEIKNFSSALTSLYSAFLGFIVSTIAIMATVLEFRRFQALNESGHSFKLLSSFISLSWITLVSLLIGILGSLKIELFEKEVFALNIASFVIWFLFFVVAMDKFQHLLKARYGKIEFKNINTTVIKKD